MFSEGTISSLQDRVVGQKVFMKKVPKELGEPGFSEQKNKLNRFERQFS